GALVNEEGIEVTDEMMEEKLKRDSLFALPAIVEYVHAYDRLNPDNQKQAKEGKGVKEIPRKYLFVDSNNDGFISPPEIGKATEDFMANKSPLESKDFYQLIDFYFKQYR
ncbi:MAG: hypothetical protein ACKOKF_09500, partial [Bacteroidota bacterium]